MFDVLVGISPISAFYIFIPFPPILKTSAGVFSFLFSLLGLTFLFNIQSVDYLSFFVNVMGGLMQHRVLVSEMEWFGLGRDSAPLWKRIEALYTATLSCLVL